ncbi:oligosaccharide flippase family protein [uncultured Duncaniella sp.]|jgi:PST family polysaccharide transporter|uniref:oligosaccharide flippase family protein n=1 Tax=uncultured Duncaniella sp. TaxID=2768039 RepID=UPI002676C7B0|nr:oligosaccharide flippase family protein [uncultured Duncaniella sp.]MCI9171703.1 oligosaccharide flippase family protein [Muribaculaceae bacterium]
MNKTSSIVIRAMGLFGSLQMLNILCGVIRIKIIALLLGTVGVGLFAIFNSALTMISAVTQLGLRESAVRTIASASDPEERDGRVITTRRWGFLLGLFGMAVTLVLSPVLSITAFGDLTHTWLYMLLAIPVLLLAGSASEVAILQGTGRLRHMARASVTGALTGLLLGVPAVYFLRLHSILPVLAIYALAGYAGTLCYRYTPPRPAGPRPTLARLWADGSPMLRLGAYMTLATVVTEAVNYLFIAFLNLTGGTGNVGIYQAGYTIVIRYAGMLFTAIAVEYYPRLASNCSRPWRQRVFVNHEMRLLFLLLTPALMVLTPLLPIVVKLLYSSQFLGAVPFMLWAMPSMLLQSFSLCVAYLILARGEGRLFAVTETVSAVASLLLHIAGYTLGGMAGLGIGFTAGYAIYALIMWRVYRHRYGYRLPTRVGLLLGAGLLLTTLTATLCHYLA